MSNVKRYRVARDTSDGQPTNWLGPFMLVKELSTSRKMLGQRGGRFTITVRGNNSSVERGLPATMSRLALILRRSKNGDMVVIASSKGGKVILRTVMVKVKIPDSPGTDPVDKFRAVVFSRWPTTESWGICNCRPIAGSNSWSQHSWCNAEDYHADEQTMKEITALGRNNWQLYRSGYVIHDKMVSFEGDSSHVYNGVDPHYDHVHIDFTPERIGTPPCA